MIPRTDAVLHIASVTDLVAWFATTAPGHLAADGQTIIGFDRTPTHFTGDAGLVYVRVPSAEMTTWAAAPGVTILARAPYAGPGTPDTVYAALFTDAGMVALYDAVYDRTPFQADDGQGGTVTVTPPDRFGQMG
ncbi:hypothetical protein [Acidimangrovimonas pyrenivorans]|uniref:Uncharacterized protein n=1 Tax=Acidimangrovimonas pyrenivorans TaxID=2030798 RepID=A0ABV7AMH7_9RHOB